MNRDQLKGVAQQVKGKVNEVVARRRAIARSN